MVQWPKAHTPFKRVQRWFPAPRTDSSELSVTLTPGKLTPSLVSAGTSTSVHILTQRHTFLIKNKIKQSSHIRAYSGSYITSRYFTQLVFVTDSSTIEKNFTVAIGVGSSSFQMAKPQIDLKIFLFPNAHTRNNIQVTLL